MISSSNDVWRIHIAGVTYLWERSESFSRVMTLEDLIKLITQDCGERALFDPFTKLTFMSLEASTLIDVQNLVMTSS